jgi:putative membrane protein
MSKKTLLAALVGAVITYLPVYSKTSTSAENAAAFLKMAAEADMTTAHLGKLAEDRGATPTIKDFGKTLVQDHTSDYEQLTELAAKLGDTIPRAIDKENGRSIAALDRYHGKTFDRAFLIAQTTGHKELFDAFKREAEHGSNPALRDYANKALPTLERHLHQAQDLLKQKA